MNSTLMSRLFPRDTRIVNVSPTGRPHLRVIAGETAGKHQLNVMLVNDSDAPRTVRLVVPGLSPKTVRLFHYFENDRPADTEGFALPSALLPDAGLAAGLEIVLTARGCIFVATE